MLAESCEKRNYFSSDPIDGRTPQKIGSYFHYRLSLGQLYNVDVAN